MTKNLVIVESPAKAKTIEGFLGKDFTVKSCYGHIRDLSKEKNGVEIDNGFKPIYQIPDEKKQLVSELKKLAKGAEMVWLASDEDREGEAISWHLAEVLKLKEANTKRIVFHEITKTAILKAIENPRSINYNLVNAQQARRVLDRIVGFELSPILWRKVRPQLSAGRVQSVAVRLIVEREREIAEFSSDSAFRVLAEFVHKNRTFKAELSQRFKTAKEAEDFLNSCKEANFEVSSVDKKPTKRSPSAPFTTSTLQQEASRKLGFSVAQTMAVAQRLYESGHITYMRTDSVNLSEMALNASKDEILKSYGENYSKTRKYNTKTASAQEAHEAIRPTYFNNHSINGDSADRRLYELIWKRAIASQMADAQIEKTIININISNSKLGFAAQGEVIKFDGFLKVYLEDNDDEETENDETLLPAVKAGEPLLADNITAQQKFTRPAPRYTEASLVKRLEELGIGRPSTYAPTISTIQKRGYVIKEDREGKERKFITLQLKENNLSKLEQTEIYGSEKSKLFPTDIGILVNDFLMQHFENIMDYGFTASVEKQFDEIADGLQSWTKMLESFYGPFHDTVGKTLEVAVKVTGERKLGTEPQSNKEVIVRMGKFGPFAQIGETSEEEKPKYASLRKGQSIETITLAEALELFKLPREVGVFEDLVMKASIGKFGPYITHNKAFYSIPKTDDPFTIDEQRAIEIIEAKRKQEAERLIKSFDEDPELQLLNGRWGPYLVKGKNNYKLSKEAKENPKALSYDDCLHIINSSEKVDTKPKRNFRKKK
jgi:DNA topoisomerase-1